MTEIKRYDVWQGVLLEREDGDWVKHEDHSADIARLQWALEHQRHETGKRQSQIDRLTQQNADMAAWINAQQEGAA